MPDQGTLHEIDGRSVLRFERTFRRPPADVWRAITDPELVPQWFPARVDGERAAGAQLSFVFEHGEGPTLGGEIRVYEPPHTLEMIWGDEVLRFELAPDGDGTSMVFLNTFDDIEKAARDAAGWHSCLDVLTYVVAGDEPTVEAKERWREVHSLYVAAFPPEAAVKGPPE